MMNRSPRLTIALATALAVLTASAAADPADPSAATTVVRRCAVEFEFDTPVGSPTFSILQDCLVRLGDRVKAGQVLGRLQDEDVKSEVRLREAEASSDVEVRLSEARSAQASGKAQRTTALVQRNAASREELLLHKLEAAAAALEVEQARHKRRLAALQLDRAKAVLRTRELVSPHDGVVAAVVHRQGEAVAPRDPIFQIIDPNRLRVVAKVDVTDLARLRVGQAARVVPEIAGADLPVEHEVFHGRIAYIDSRIDPETRTCRVHVLTENRAGALRAGLEARVEFDPEAAQPAASAPPQPPPGARTRG